MVGNCRNRNEEKRKLYSLESYLSSKPVNNTVVEMVLLRLVGPSQNPTYFVGAIGCVRLFNYLTENVGRIVPAKDGRRCWHG